ncbi:MAG: hypothetical protein KDA99_26860, partial [Planctomycetales bacterium]|nr:hypothetical protein [Planctomycetales bacterium]
RMVVNACLWALGMEDSIEPDGEIGFVGPYHPVTFNFEGYRRGVKPEELSGWDSPIMREDAPVQRKQ